MDQWNRPIRQLYNISRRHGFKRNYGWYRKTIKSYGEINEINQQINKKIVKKLKNSFCKIFGSVLNFVKIDLDFVEIAFKMISFYFPYN